MVDLGHRRLFVPLRLFAEYRQRGRGMVFGTGHWEWIFWQNAALAPVMMLLTAVAMPRRPVDRDLLRRTDWAGIVYAGVGFGLIYAGLDQGNRLDWLNSGVVTGLLLG